MEGDMAHAQQPARLAGSTMGAHNHVCAFFQSREEEYRLLLPFIAEGFARGERAFHIVDKSLRQDHLHRLDRAGIPVDAAGDRPQLEVHDWEDVYLRGGQFLQHDMLALVDEVLGGPAAAAFPQTRVVAHMEWALGDFPGVDDLVEYETRLNHVLPRYPGPVVCVYDSARFGAGLALDVLRTHPLVILGGVLQVNPFFVPPDEFLRELRERKERVVPT
jgi:hypothetical protein